MHKCLDCAGYCGLGRAGLRRRTIATMISASPSVYRPIGAAVLTIISSLPAEAALSAANWTLAGVAFIAVAMTGTRRACVPSTLRVGVTCSVTA